MFNRKSPARPPVNMPKRGTPLTGDQLAGQKALAAATPSSLSAIGGGLKSMQNSQRPPSINMTQMDMGKYIGPGKGPVPTAQTSKQATPPPTVIPKGLNPNFKSALATAPRYTGPGFGPTKPMKKGGSVSLASKRADGCAVKGKTKGKMV